MPEIKSIKNHLIHNNGIFNNKNEIMLIKRINELTDKINELVQVINKLQYEQRN